MILVRLTGGLGNQMFQYAFGKSLALNLRTELKLDCSLLGSDDKVKDLVVREYDLDIFDIKVVFASEMEIEVFNGTEGSSLLDRAKYKVRKGLGFNQLIIQRNQEFDLSLIRSVKSDSCIVGRWQSELYFKEHEKDMRKEFTFKTTVPNLESAELLKGHSGSILVGVHVRRGDYVDHPIYSKSLGTPTVKYYVDAINYVNQKMSGALTYIFVSDDIDWCEANFGHFNNSVFLKQQDNKLGYASDMWILTKCNHMIISNSTFSWWGAWLGEKKDSIVVAPNCWAKDIKFVPEKIIPNRWIRLPNELD